MGSRSLPTVRLATPSGNVVCERCEVALTKLARLRGSFDRRGRNEAESGLLRKPASWTHTLFRSRLGGRRLPRRRPSCRQDGRAPGAVEAHNLLARFGRRHAGGRSGRTPRDSAWLAAHLESDHERLARPATRRHCRAAPARTPERRRAGDPRSPPPFRPA